MEKNRYKRTFCTGDFCLRVHSNSKPLLAAVERFLDCPKQPFFSRRQLTVTYRCNVWARRRGKVISYNRFSPAGDLLLSAGRASLSAEANPRTRIVNAEIVDLERMPVENIIDHVIMNPLRFIAAHHGLFFLHASLVAKGDECLIITGPQNSGKSTIALVLAKNGFDLLCDDDCFITLRKDRPQAVGFPTKAGTSDRFLARNPWYAKSVLKNYRYGGKRRLRLGAARPDTSAKQCRILLFPRYEKKGGLRLKRLTPEQSFAALQLKNMNSQSGIEAQKRFWTLYRLVRDVDSYELRYNDGQLDRLSGVIGKLF